MANESINIAQIAAQAESVGDTFFIVILIILGVGVIVGAFLYWRYVKSFRHTIVLREKTKGATDLVTITNYRYTGGVGDTEAIQLWYNKTGKPCPPPESIDFKRNGAEYVEGWLSETGEIKYIQTELKTIEASKFEEYVKLYQPNFIKRLVFWLKTFRNPNPPPIQPEFIKYLTQSDKPAGKIEFKALDTKDKEFYANQHFKALRFKKKDFLTWVSENAGLIAVIFIVLLMFAFWQEITQPMSNVATQLAKVSEGQAVIMENVNKLITERQQIEAERSGQLNNTIKPD